MLSSKLKPTHHVYNIMTSTCIQVYLQAIAKSHCLLHYSRSVCIDLTQLCTLNQSHLSLTDDIVTHLSLSFDCVFPTSMTISSSSAAVQIFHYKL